MRESLTAGQYARRIGRCLIAIACLVIALTWFLFIAAPGFIGPMFGPSGSEALPSLALFVVGVVGQVGGLVWMIRIHRADPEPDQHAWRYRELET